MVASSTASKDKDESPRDNEEDEDSIFSSPRKSNIPKVNILGTDIKLDSLSLISLALGGIAALGTGYLIYNQFNSQKQQEEQRRKMENQRQAEYMRYLQAQQEEQRRMRELEEQTELVNKEKSKLTPEQEAEQREIERYENGGPINMNLLPKSNYPDTQPLSYEQLLTRHNDDLSYYPNQVSSLAPGYQPNNGHNQGQNDNDPTLIDMNRLLQNPNMEVNVPVEYNKQQQQKRKKIKPQEEYSIDEEGYEQQLPAPVLPYRGPTPAEIMASMNNDGGSNSSNNY